MNEILIAVIASVPGLIAGLAAWRAARKRLTYEEVAALRREVADANRQVADANRRIEHLEEQVEECNKERRILMRENLDLYRKLNAA